MGIFTFRRSNLNRKAELHAMPFNTPKLHIGQMILSCLCQVYVQLTLYLHWSVYKKRKRGGFVCLTQKSWHTVWPYALPEISWNPTVKVNLNANLGFFSHNLGIITLLVRMVVGNTTSNDRLQAPPDSNIDLIYAMYFQIVWQEQPLVMAGRLQWLLLNSSK